VTGDHLGSLSLQTDNILLFYACRLKPNTCLKTCQEYLIVSNLNFKNCTNYIPLVVLNFDYDVCCEPVIT
jgi:hypothetical protein